MRYFFASTRPESALSIGIIVSTATRCTVAFGHFAQTSGSGLSRATIGAIDVTAVAITTEDDLAVAMRAVEQSGTGFHRHTRPMGAGI